MSASGPPAGTPGHPGAPPPGRRLRRGERREQILTAATRAFARSGFATTSLDDVVGEAGISRVILYRHFESKTDLYRAVLDRARRRLTEACGAGQFTQATVPALVGAAADDPDAFRLLFHYAALEPEFSDEMSEFRANMVAIAHRHLTEPIHDAAWANWAAELAPIVVIEAITAWLDAGQPDPPQAAERVRQLLEAVTTAAQPPEK
jgi:AcrR family transcriptional regulator